MVYETEIFKALIAAAPKDYLSSINSHKIVKEMSDLYWMQKERNIKLENYDDNDGYVNNCGQKLQRNQLHMQK